jgi:hypothetical protein
MKVAVFWDIALRSTQEMATFKALLYIKYKIKIFVVYKTSANNEHRIHHTGPF